MDEFIDQVNLISSHNCSTTMDANQHNTIVRRNVEDKKPHTRRHLEGWQFHPIATSQRIENAASTGHRRTTIIIDKFRFMPRSR